jgi:hypothetical protein
MAATKVTVTYEDGTTDSVSVKPIDLVMAERHFKGSLPPVEGTLFAAWSRLKPGSSFNDWLALLAAIDEQQEESVPLAETPSPAE